MQRGWPSDDWYWEGEASGAGFHAYTEVRDALGRVVYRTTSNYREQPHLAADDITYVFEADPIEFIMPWDGVLTEMRITVVLADLFPSMGMPGTRLVAVPLDYPTRIKWGEKVTLEHAKLRLE